MALRKKVNRCWLEVYEIDPRLREIEDNMYLIKKGVRGAYTTSITAPREPIEFAEDRVDSLTEILSELEGIVKEEGLHLYSYLLPHNDMYDLDDEDTAVVWIYRFPHQGEILRSLKGDHSYLEEWIIGKLLGYDDYAMEEFLKKNF